MSNQDLGQVLLTRVWVFQAIVAAPTFTILGIAATINLFSTWDTIYDFITFLFTSILAAGIIFIVSVQLRYSNATKALTFRFEVAKSVLATALWIWLMYDAIFGPSSHGSNRGRRIAASSIAVVLLL
jgi:hypothetical protein